MRILISLLNWHGPFKRFQVRSIVQESPIYHRVEGSLLFQNPMSLNSAKFIPLYYLINFSR